MQEVKIDIKPPFITNVEARLEEQVMKEREHMFLLWNVPVYRAMNGYDVVDGKLVKREIK